MTLRNAFTLALAGLMAAGLSLQPAPAAACGGFFCDNSQPVNQQAERIIFAQEPDGTVTAVIQIQYEGPSERFAWMLPVSGSPDISVSSNAAFQRLQGASNPQYTMTRTVEGTCMDADFAFGAPTADGEVSLDAGLGGGGPEDPVTVVDEGSVGPYDFVIISIDPDAADQVAIAIEWLQENGFDVPDMGSDVLRPYIEDMGQNLLAFRLTKGNDAGAIRPVRLSFGEGLPSIPLRPTAIATVPDMGILVWVLGPSRAVPANYRSLELNEALINWFNPGSTYDAVVSRAANEAQGQGFVTEMSGSAPELGAVVWNEWEGERWEDLQTQDWTGREGELIGRSQDFFFLDGMREVLEAHVTPPDGVPAEEFYDCIGCYLEFDTPDVEGFEPEDFLADMAEEVIEPMVETQELFERTAVQTRLYTTMSADEMTDDPVFDFNADLPEVSNRHTADRIIECSPAVSQFEAPWRVELASGDIVRGEGNTWPFDLETTSMPASAIIKRVGPTGTGEGEVEEDNTDVISRALVQHNRTIPGPPTRRPGFCSASPPGQSAAGFGILALALGALLFRRRQV